MSIIKDGADLSEKVVESQIRYQGDFLCYRSDTVINPQGRHANRDVIEHPGATCVLAFTDEQTVLLEWQYRHPVGKHLWEIPAGKIDAGEDWLACAQRELLEETGYVADDWRWALSFETAPGFSNEVLHLFIAKQLTYIGHAGIDDEFIDVRPVPLITAQQMIREGKITDAKTLTALLWWLAGQRSA